MRVALLGYGSAGEPIHARLIATTAGLELAAIVTRDPERRERARRAHPEAELLDAADEVWKRAEAMDLVVVATPNRSHVPLATAALEHGLGVVVDKPFALSASEARAVVELGQRRDRLVTVFQNRRWDGDFLAVRRLVEGGALGDVLRFESRLERWMPEVAEGWRELADPAEGGGVLYDLGSHSIDQAMLLFGPAQAVYAEVGLRRAGAQIDDDVFVALTHQSGVHSHLWMSLNAEHIGPRFRVLGSRAGFVTPSETTPEPDEHERFYEGVVTALREGSPPPVDPKDAIAGLEVIEAAQASARDGQVVRL
jgi:scyllo-inositol 2-dehydrogenase (NADP+)